MPHKSKLPTIEYRNNETVWSWLFESPRFENPGQNRTVPERCVLNAATNEKIIYSQLKIFAEYLSSAFFNLYGLRQGDTVILFSPNGVWYPVVMHAVVRIGGIVGGSSPSSNTEEMLWTLKVSRAKYIVTASESLQVAVDAASKAGIPRERVILMEGHAAGYHSVSDLVSYSKNKGRSYSVASFEIPNGKTNGDICGYLSFTSGTTGKPKACMISHQNVIAQCLQMNQITSPNVDKVLAVLPLYHITGLVHLLHLPIFRKADIILMPKFNIKSMLDIIVRYQIRELTLVPPLLIRMVEDPIVSQYDLTCIRIFSSGSAPMPPRILNLLQVKFPHAGFKQGWGMTESCSCLTAHDPEHYDYKYSATVGPIVANTELMFVNEAGEEVDGEGEILARGPQCAMAYLDNPQATQETFVRGGWLRTGDLGRMLPNGCVQITGRLKEIIKVKGVGVAPVELEELLLSHPAVLDVAVIGLPDEYSGETPHACVIAAPGLRASPALSHQLIEFVKNRKNRTKWVSGVSFIKEVPRAGSGKIMRRQLKAQLQNLRITIPKM